uniref:Uncharacterized protein n=1 Tax=Oryzias sinensis TaxID=183150 RepID=A0A8C7Y6U0_9TELE
VINKHIYLSDKGHSCISSIIISLSDGEWNKTTEVPTGLRDDVFASSLEVKVKAIKGVVVGISPSPAGGCVLGDAHSLTPLNTACLLHPTVSIFAGICDEHKENLDCFRIYNLLFKNLF